MIVVTPNRIEFHRQPKLLGTIVSVVLSVSPVLESPVGYALFYAFLSPASYKYQNVDVLMCVIMENLEKEGGEVVEEGGGAENALVG